MPKTRLTCWPSAVKSMSIVSPSGRRSPLSRCMAIAMAKRIAMAVMKITQPSKKCRNPSAWLIP